MKPLARGQTMVLWALTLLLLSLMVLVTLSFGQRVKEKMEVESVADAAALSNAAVTARVFNEIALMNRAQIGQMVSMAAVESLISWSGYYRAQLAATRDGYDTIRDVEYLPLMIGCFVPFPSTWCTCMLNEIDKLSNERQTKLQIEENRIAAMWDAQDQAAGQQARLLQDAAGLLEGFEAAEYIRLELKIQGQALAGDIVNRASAGNPWGEWSAPGGADNVATREIEPVLGAVEPFNPASDHVIAATMGSRGWSFTRDRGNAQDIITAKLMTLVDPTDTVVATDTGSGYFAGSMNHSALFPSGAFAWADDHGDNAVVFNDPSAAGQCLNTGAWGEGVTADVKSTDSSDQTDEHVWSPSDGSDSVPADTRHTLGSCIICPGMWPVFTDYNWVRGVMSGDNYGQPKNYATIVRNYNNRPSTADPWNLFFNFKLGSSTGGATFDSHGVTLGAEAGNLDVSRQVGLSTGIAYYHRGGGGPIPGSHWKEPPNFLNPYWRATLVPSDTDDQGKGSDVPDTLNNANAAYAAGAYNALKGAGFTGWP